MSSTNSLDGGAYQRLRDYSDMEDGLGRDVHHQHGIYAYSQPSTRPATPGIGPGSAGVAPSAGSLSAATARAKKTTKKGRRMAWLLIHHTGEVQTVHMDKRQLIQMLGLEVPMRDLRLMDPALAAWETFAQLLVRDNALVVSAEHVRLLITCDKVIFPLEFEKTEASERFMKHVEAVIKERPDCPAHLAPPPASSAAAACAAARIGGGSGGGISAAVTGLAPGSGGRTAALLSAVAAATGSGGGGGGGGLLRGGSGGSAGPRDPELLPFELNMLEVSLGEITRHYAQQTASLEALAHPALDALMRNCNSTNLERVRKIKTQHQRLQGRLQGLREIMERYLEDDQDMYRMCLSKLREQELENADAGSDNMMLMSRHSLVPGSLQRRHSLHAARSPSSYMERCQGLAGRLGRGNVDGGSSSSSSSSSGSSRGAAHHDLLEVENLLESYFMMIDGTLAKLAGIGEYIDDTEDYINIELDYNRNRLLRIEILLTVATFALAIYNLVAGILGENLVLPELWTSDLRGFIVINIGTFSMCVTIFFVVWRVMVAKKMI